MAKFKLGGLVPRVRLINRPFDGTHSLHTGEDFEKERCTELFELIAMQIECESTYQIAKKMKRGWRIAASKDVAHVLCKAQKLS